MIDFDYLYKIIPKYRLEGCLESRGCLCQTYTRPENLLPGEKEYLESHEGNDSKTFVFRDGLWFVDKCDCRRERETGCLPKTMRFITCISYPLYLWFEKIGKITVMIDRTCPLYEQITLRWVREMYDVAKYLEKNMDVRLYGKLLDDYCRKVYLFDKPEEIGYYRITEVKR